MANLSSAAALRLRSYRQLVTGNVINLAEPHTYKFEISEIAELLSMVKRFNGASTSVLEHSMICADMALEMTGSYALSLCCLLHDAAEAYIGDIATPVKFMLLPMIEKLEGNVSNAIFEQLVGLPSYDKFIDGIKLFDKLALRLEIEELKREYPNVCTHDAWGDIRNIPLMNGLAYINTNTGSQEAFVRMYNGLRESMLANKMSHTPITLTIAGTRYNVPILSVEDVEEE